MIDTTNRFMVASQGDELVILNPPRRLSADDALLLLAAYLVAMAYGATHNFDDVLKAVQDT